MIPLKDFFRNPKITNYQISPDAQFISFTKSYKNRLNIFIQSRGSGRVKRITSETSRDIFYYTWKGNDNLVYLKDFGGDENYHIFAIDKQAKAAKDLTPFKGVKAEIIDDLADNDTDLIIGLNKRNREVFDAYRLNVVNGRLTLIEENPGNIIGWLTDHSERIRAAMATEGANTTLLYREAIGQPFKKVLDISFPDTLSPLFFAFDDKALYCLSNLNRDTTAVVKFDPKEARELEVIFEDPEFDAANLEYSRRRKALTAVYFISWKAQRKILDKETEGIFNFLSAQLPDTEIFPVSYNRAEDVFIVKTVSDRSAGAYYLYEKNQNSLLKLAETMPWLKKEDLRPVEPISYKSRDGLTIYGYLTLPEPKAGKPFPAVIHPHGGPWARDVWWFNREVQFLANRGYAVLQMNFRGSTGYGKKFVEASFKQWGRKMQDDITDGVKWLIAQGKIDPKRVAIYGGSYGGYAVLAGLSFTPELYACGVDYVGVSNLLTFLKSIPPYWKPYLEMLHKMAGDPQTDKELFEEISPLFHADNIRVPLLVAQGAKDPRVNINESNQIVAALRKRKIPVTYLVKQNEGHGFRNQENRLDFYRAMEKFLAKHLGR